MDTARLVIAVDSSGAAKATRNLDNLDRAAGNSERAAHKLGRAWGVAIGLLSSAVIIGATRAFLKQADAMANLNARLGLVTDSTQALAKAQKDVFDIAQRTATDLEATADLYTKLAQSSDELRGNQERLAGIVETVSQSLVVSGADAASTAAVIRQFSQALASGSLRGDEFISVMEGAPRLARAIADGLGVPIGQLRELARQGELTADKIITSLESQSEAIDREYGKMPLTVGRAVEKVENALSRMIGKTAESTGATSGLATKIDELATLLQSPGVQEGFNTFVGGLADVARFALKATTELANFGEWVGESIARARGFTAMDDIAGVRDRLEKIRDAQAQRQGDPLAGATGVLKAMFSTDWQDLGIADMTDEELDAERRKLEAYVKVQEELARIAQNAQRWSNVQGSAVGSWERHSTATGGTGGAAAAIESIQKAMTLEEEWAILETEVYTPALIEAHNARATAWANESQIVEKATDTMTVFAEQAARNIQDTLGEGLLAVTKGRFDEIGDNFADMLQRMLADLAASKLLELFGSWATGYKGAGSGLINAIGSALGGGRAGEGPVMAGQSYWVGEKGRELFTPATNGTVSNGGAMTLKQGDIKLEVINNGQPAEASVSRSKAPDGSQLIRLVLSAVGDSIANGHGEPYRAVKQRFGLREPV